MHFAHLSRLDLNLLVALDVLLDEGTVTAAAARLGLSQPAMSRTLARLRETFGDPLLVRAGRAMVMTPRAKALHGPLKRALTEVEAVMLDRPGFEPESATRTFTVATTDYGESIVLPALVAELALHAPKVNVVVPPSSEHRFAAMESGEVDVVLMVPRPTAPTIVWRRLFTDGFMSMLRKGHPALRRPLTAARFAALPQILISPEGRPGGVVDEPLRRLRLERRVAVTVPSFLVTPFIVAQTDLVVTTAERVARRFAPLLGLELLDPPIPVPRFTFSLAWHERSRHDPGHQWFRGLIEQVARNLA